ncbi:ty3-gypsy retrotransposon protein [Tanacetum coccineum]
MYDRLVIVIQQIGHSHPTGLKNNLGHVVTRDGVAADPSKVKAMLEWPVLKSIRQLRGFLGLTGYYRKFVKGYVLPDFSQPIVVEVDASGFGIGAVLFQNKRAIAYFSQVLGPRSRLKSVYERELMAIVLAIHKWRPYLLGKKFIVRTDQRSLKYLLEQWLVSEEHQRWLSKLVGYDFEIQYRPRIENRVVDALSRRGEDPKLAALSIPWVIDWEELVREITRDPRLSTIRGQLTKGESAPHGYSMDGQRLLYKGRLVIPRYSPWIPKLFHEFYNSVVGGHSGALKTQRRMAKEVYWVGMKKDIEKLVAECDIFVDRLSKYAHFVPLRHPYTAKTVAAAFLREVVRLHGIPESIVSDRDRVFLNHFWRELFKLQGTNLKRSSSYHPQTDGQSEVVNRSVETYLRCFASDAPKKWARWLSWAEYWYNTSYHTSMNMTPFKVLYGRDPPHLIYYGSVPSPVFEVHRYLEERDCILKELKEHLLRAQERMKKQADKHRTDVEFEVGDWVYIKLQPYRQHSLAIRRNEKLSPKYFGSYQVLERVGKVAYKLELPTTTRIHSVFHISQFKKMKNPTITRQELPAGLTEDMELILVPDRVEGVREGKSSSKEEREVLIKWKDLPTHEATWELYSTIQKQFPDFRLEDKVAV